jgi:hypothetical protein
MLTQKFTLMFTHMFTIMFKDMIKHKIIVIVILMPHKLDKPENLGQLDKPA